jgi:DNA-binding LacI/PurR family transcriptional regulator
MSTLKFDASRAGHVAGLLLDMVQGDNMAVGSRLPGMRELAGRFDTSITTVQAAVHMLHERGMLECRPSKGAFVKYRPPASDAGPAGKQIGILTPAWRSDIGRQQVPNRRRNWWTRIIDGATGRLHLDGYRALTVPYYYEDLDKPQVIRQVLDDAGDLAAVITPARPQFIRELEARQAYWASISQPDETSVTNFVGADNIAACRALGRCLAGAGLHRVALLLDQVNYALSSMERIHGVYQGFIDARVATSGLEILETELYGIYEHHAFEHVTRRLQRGDHPQAIVAIGDYLAVGALRAVQAFGLRVPQDVAVIGGTGDELAEYTTPALSVVQQPMERMGWELGSMIVRMISERRRRVIGRRVPAPLVFRESFTVDAELCREAQRAYERDMARFEMETEDGVAAE